MKKQVLLPDVLHETLQRLAGDGILLVAGDPPNPMTIGWGTVGPIWNRQIMTVMVRPVRYTFGLMEQVKDFSVCVLPDGFAKELLLCGSKSGRNTDKIAACKFSMEKCATVDAFCIAESIIHFECTTVHKQVVDGATLDPAIVRRYYPARDFHTVYYGEIKGIFVNG